MRDQETTDRLASALTSWDPMMQHYISRSGLYTGMGKTIHASKEDLGIALDEHAKLEARAEARRSSHGGGIGAVYYDQTW